MNEFHVTYGPEYARSNHPHAPRCHLQIVGFPCNQFGLQEPAHNDELLNGLKYVRPGHGFVPNFNLTTKIEVNGKKENKIFTFLKSRCPAPKGIVSTKMYNVWSPIRANDVSWNFQKWLIDADGHPHRRYEADYTPEMMEGDIRDMITECARSRTQVPEPEPQPQASADDEVEVRREKFVTKRSKKEGGSRWKYKKD